MTDGQRQERAGAGPHVPAATAHAPTGPQPHTEGTGWAQGARVHPRARQDLGQPEPSSLPAIPISLPHNKASLKSQNPEQRGAARPPTPPGRAGDGEGEELAALWGLVSCWAPWGSLGRGGRAMPDPFLLSSPWGSSSSCRGDTGRHRGQEDVVSRVGDTTGDRKDLYGCKGGSGNGSRGGQILPQPPCLPPCQLPCRQSQGRPGRALGGLGLCERSPRCSPLSL